MAQLIEENAGKPKPGWLVLCWFCPSASITAKVATGLKFVIPTAAKRSPCLTTQALPLPCQD